LPAMSVARIEGKILPILPARNVDETIRFYERLGFSVVGRFGGKRRYLVLMRDDAELHFFLLPSLDPRTNINGCYLRIADADALYAEWRAVLDGLAPPQDRDWGLREFTLVDPSGNLLRVGSPIR
jgi:catechol 2,3-dioxygenase-like lactoylglutathione lyase family enzyme